MPKALKCCLDSIPYSLRETKFGLSHLLLGVKRRLFKQPADAPLAKLVQTQKRLSPRAIRLDDGNFQVCHMCGFAIAEIEFDNGWLMQACCAIGFDSLLSGKNHTFEEWRKTLAISSLQAKAGQRLHM